MPLLTKSKYIQAVQCKKQLWISTQHPELMDIDEDRQFIFDQGTAVGVEAQKLFPGAELISQSLPFIDKLSKTKQMVDDRLSLFEGAFKWDQCFCIVDALIFNGENWDLIEVKSSTGVKPIHYHDAGFQWFVLNQLGICIDNIILCHINTSYERQGALDHSSLFKLHDITDDVQDLIPTIKKNIHDYLPIFKMESVDYPIGPHCYSPYECSAINHCWKRIPENSVFDITELSIQDKFSHYFQERINLTDFLPSDFSKFKQRQQVSCEIEGLDFIDHEKLKAFLLNIQYPISYLDFESFQTAIPPFQGTSPYEQIPFQFSLHIEDQSLHHNDFISSPDVDPRPLILNELKLKVPASGSIIVFNKQYESLILRSIKSVFPEESLFIDNLISRLVDLEEPFKNNYIYMRGMKGKTSIKFILPALCPSFSYDNLKISSGRSINAMVDKLRDPDTRDNAYMYLSEYGRLDTYAMVLIIKELKNLINF